MIVKPYSNQLIQFLMQISENTIKQSQIGQGIYNIFYLKLENILKKKHQKCIQTQEIDLIKLIKHQNLDQLINYLQIFMVLFMQSTNKEEFIQSIMNLQENQSIFVEIIKKSFRSSQIYKSQISSLIFIDLFFNFNNKNQHCKNKSKGFLKLIYNYFQKLRNMNKQIINYIAEFHPNIEQGRNIKYLEEYINMLQQRIVEQGKQNEQQKIYNMEKIVSYTKDTKLEQMEELSKIYKDKYDQSMEQMQKMNTWKRFYGPRTPCSNLGGQLKKLNSLISLTLIKNINRKKVVEIQKISNYLKKVMENKTGHTSNSFTSKIVESFLLDQIFRQCFNSKLSEQSNIYKYLKYIFYLLLYKQSYQ